MRFVYLHGFASAPSSRKAQYFQAELHRRNVSLEIPALDAGDFSALTISGQLKLLEETLQGEPAALIGSSLGGYLSALYASQHPEVNRLVLLAPAFEFAELWRRSATEQQMTLWKETGYVDVHHYGEGGMRRVHYGLYQDALQYPGDPDFMQPARIFHGDSDTVVPAALSQRFAAEHPNATCTVLSSGHELTNVLDRIAADAIPFLLDR